jgi:small subunit ribosomal protein S1
VAALEEAPAETSAAERTGSDAHSLSAEGVFADDEALDDKDALYAVFEDLIKGIDFSFKQGDVVSGTVFEIDQKGAYLDIGAKSAAFCPTAEVSLCKIGRADEVLALNSKREFVIIQDKRKDGEIWVSLKQQEYALAWHRIRQMSQEDIKVEVLVVGANRGGIIVSVDHIRGFIPGSHLTQPPEDLEELVGTKLMVKFLEVDEEQERVVFSARRAHSEAFTSGFKVGDVVVGTVQSVKPYGAFVDIGGVNGLLHISQISEDRVTNVEAVLSEGDKLKVMVLSQDRDKGRVALSTRKLERTKGDMLRDPQKVFEYADEVAAELKQSLMKLEKTDASLSEAATSSVADPA